MVILHSAFEGTGPSRKLAFQLSLDVCKASQNRLLAVDSAPNEWVGCGNKDHPNAMHPSPFADGPHHANSARQCTVHGLLASLVQASLVGTEDAGGMAGLGMQ